MSFAVSIKPEEKSFLRIQKVIKSFPEKTRVARNKTLTKTGNYLRSEVRKTIEKGVDNAHPLSSLYRKKYSVGKDLSGKKSPWRRSFFNLKPFDFLGKFARFSVRDRGPRGYVIIGFGKTKRKQEGKFDRQLSRIAARAIRGKRTRVTPEMRRLFALRRGIGLKKSTKTLETPKRPFMKRAFTISKSKAASIYKEKFPRTLSKELSRV